MTLRHQQSIGLGWVRVLIALAPVGILMTGCIVVPISGPSETPLYGKRIKEQEITSVAAVGKSREEVISNLGKPTIELNDLRILVYPWMEDKGAWLILFFSAGGPFGGTGAVQENWLFLVAFDDKDRVLHAGLVKRKEFDSINTVVRKWGEAQGLSLPPQQATFTLLPIPKNKSLFYIFRAKPPTSWRTMIGMGFSWPWPVAVAVDGQYLSELHNETYTTLTVEPGKHELLADAKPPYLYAGKGSLELVPDKRRPASISLNTLPNQVYFVRLLCTTGTGTIDTSLTPKTEAEAIPVIQQFRSAW